MLESLFDKVADLQPCNFIKKRLQNRRFPVKFARFLSRKKKLVLFPEIGRVKIFLSLTRPYSRMCIKKQQTNKQKNKNKKKQKKLKKKREYLQKID